MVKNFPAKQEMLVPSLSQEDPLEKAMATHSNILAWKILWGHKELDTMKETEEQMTVIRQKK